MYNIGDYVLIKKEKRPLQKNTEDYGMTKYLKLSVFLQKRNFMFTTYVT